MPPILKALGSSVGRKLIMALSGLALVGFIIMHLAGNLTIYSPDASLINNYANKLESLGPIKEVMEWGIFAIFGLHILMALNLKWGHKQARPVGYKQLSSKGGPSRSNISSRNMIVTGAVLFAFLILHLKQFAWGPDVEEGYVTQLGGEKVRDLHRLIVEVFKQPLYVGVYVFTMLLLGIHLRHGFWSAFQSLGALTPRYTKAVYALGVLLAVVLAAGFLFIPVWVYFDLGKTVGGLS